MKKFFKKYRIAIFTIIGVFLFILFSVLSEGKKPLSLEDFKVNVSTDEKSVVVIALTGCTHCHNFKPVAKKITNKYKIPLYWFEIDALSEEDQQYLLDMFESNGYEGASPYIALIKKGEVVASHTGEMDKSETIKFLKENNIIK